MKIKLLPSLREKKRYIAFDVTSKKNVQKSDLISSVKNACKDFMGEYNCGKAGIQVISDLVKGKKGVIRVNNKYTDQVKASLMLIKKINGERVIFKNNKTSGVLNKVK